MAIEKNYGITHAEELSSREKQRLWLYRNYEDLLDQQKMSSVAKAALRYGEIGLPTYGKDPNDLKFFYSSQLGLSRA